MYWWQKKLIKDNVTAALAVHIDPNLLDLRKSKLIIEINYNEGGGTGGGRARGRARGRGRGRGRGGGGGGGRVGRTVNKRYFYLDSINGMFF